MKPPPVVIYGESHRALGTGARTACAAGAGDGAGGDVPALLVLIPDAAGAVAIAPVLAVAVAVAAAAGGGWLAGALGVAGGGGGGGRASGFCGPPPPSPPVVVSCRSVMVAARDVLEINEKCYTYDAFCDVMLPHYRQPTPIAAMGGLSSLRTAYLM